MHALLGIRKKGGKEASSTHEKESSEPCDARKINLIVPFPSSFFSQQVNLVSIVL